MLLEVIVHLEIHRGFPASPSPLERHVIKLIVCVLIGDNRQSHVYVHSYDNM